MAAPIHKKRVNLCFVCDCTGTMDQYIKKIHGVIDHLASTITSEYPQMLLYLSFVAYRDWDCIDRICVSPDWTTDTTEFKSFVSSQKAHGGKDVTEDVLGGLYSALTSLTWNPDHNNMVYHVCDAPPHGLEYHGKRSKLWDLYPDGHPSDPNINDIFKGFKEKKIKYYIAQKTDFLSRMISIFKRIGNNNSYKSIELLDIRELDKMFESISFAVRNTIRLCSSSVSSNPRPLLGIKMKSYAVFVGIDFGTSGTAFAYILSGTNKVRTTQNWDDKTFINIKTRTSILLDSSKKFVAFGHNAHNKYHNLGKGDKKKYLLFNRFKMSLYEDELSKVRIEKKENDVSNLSKKIVAINGRKIKSDIIIKEALNYICKHIMNVLSSTISVDNIDDVQWFLTVPAIWTEKAKKSMITFAKRAGMSPKGYYNQIKVVYEPECASIAIFDKMGLSKNEVYMLCDCGGGTVDITVHKVGKNNSISEVWHPTGGPWGGCYVDDEYILFLNGIFGETDMNEFKEKNPAGYHDLIVQFQKAKHNAKVIKKSNTVELPNSFFTFMNRKYPDQDEYVEDKFEEFKFDFDDKKLDNLIEIDDNEVTMDNIIWWSFYNKSLNCIVNHIKMLLTKKELKDCRKIFIVGGYAESSFLTHRMNEEFSLKYQLPLINNPSLLVVEGAARLGISPQFISGRKSTYTYGIAYRRHYDEHNDPITLKTWDDDQKMYCVDGAFYAFVRKNQLIKTDEPEISYTFEAVNNNKIEVALFKSTEINPRFVTDDTCVKLGVIPIDITVDDKKVTVTFNFSETTINVKCCIDGSIHSKDILFE